MAMASGVYGPFIRDAFLNVKAFDLDSDTFKVDLVTDTHTPNFDTHDEVADLTNIVTGTGWAAAVTLSTPSFGIASGVAKFDAVDVSQATTTLTNAEGCVIWDDTIAGDPLMVAVDFGAPYSTVAGTFAITWNASGIWTLDYQP